MKFDCPRWPPDWPEIAFAINSAIESGDWGRYQSSQQDQLLQAIGQRHPAHVRLCCGGTAAIEIALRAAGVGRGDEVILAAFDYPGNYRTIEVVGARPVLVDVDEATLAVRADHIDQAASDKVRAVIVSHLYGKAANVEALRSECDDRGWTLIEDACQVPGMTIGGTAAGTIGHLGTLSFGGSKPLTSGSGGAILTNDSRLAVKIDVLLRRPSDASPLSPLQVAALLPQLERLEECNARRVATVRYLEANVIEQLTSWRWLSGLAEDVRPTHYKAAWAAKSLAQRAAINHRAAELGLPMGEGFRAMSRSSDRRCRKPVALDTAARLGQTVFVLDHSALLLDEDRHAELGAVLLQLHEETKTAG